MSALWVLCRYRHKGHWSGHTTRLNRDLSGRFGTRSYAAEELVAELTSAFLCAHLGIAGELRHAGYIQNCDRIHGRGGALKVFSPLTDQSTRDLRGSPDRFGYEWNAYAEILPEYEEQFRRWTVHLAPRDWQGKSFLDVGCGMGRNSFWPMTYGACEGCAVDIDERSLASARRNLACFPAVEVMWSSAYDLPFADRFDIAFAIGVISHLEDPGRALQGMARAVKPGGRVLIWVVGREGNRWLVPLLDPLRRILFSRMPIALVHHLSLYPAALLWLALKIGLRPTEYFKLLAGFRFSHLRSIVFDQMLPRIAHYWPQERVAELMAAAGLEDVRIASVNEMSWSAIGTRPPRSTETARS